MSTMLNSFYWIFYSLLVPISLCSLYILYRYWIYLTLCRKYQHIKGHTQFIPPQLAVLLPDWMIPEGTFKTLAEIMTPDGERRLMKRSGKPYCKIVFGFMDTGMIMVDHPDMGKEIVKNFKVYKKDKQSSMFFAELFGETNIIMEHDHQKWKHLRQLFDPCFTPTIMKSVSNVTNEILQEDVIPIFDKELIRKNFMRDVSNVAMDVIGKAGFGYNFNSVLVSENDHTAPVNKVQNLLTNIQIIQVLPFAFLRKHFKVGIIGTLHDAIYALVGEVEKVIRKREESEEDKDDMLGILLKNRRENGVHKIDGQLTNAEIQSNLFVMYLAGHESTGKSIAFSLYSLAKNPSLQQLVFNEISKMGKEYFDYEDFISGKLDTVRAVFRESLRLYPVAFGISREVTKTSEWQDLIIPKGTMLLYSWMLTQRSEEYWGSNASEFDCNRFLSDDLKLIDPHPKNPFVWTPFGIHPRKCIGNVFSEIEACNIIATLLSKYEIKLSDPNYTVELDSAIVLIPKDPISITLIPRSNNVK